MEKQINFFVRDDDVAELDRKFLDFYSLMKRLEIPVIYGVIPARLEPKMIDFLNKEYAANNSLFLPAQHGWEHKNHGMAKKYEFGETRSYEQQKKDIEQGAIKMKKYFGRLKRKVFIPPYNRLDIITLKILGELKFDAFSTDEPILHLGNMINMPAAISFEEYIKKGIEKKELRDLLLNFAVCRRKMSFFGIYLHHKNLAQKDLKIIEKFLIVLKKQKVKFVLYPPRGVKNE